MKKGEYTSHVELTNLGWKFLTQYGNKVLYWKDNERLLYDSVLKYVLLIYESQAKDKTIFNSLKKLKEDEQRLSKLN